MAIDGKGSGLKDGVAGDEPGAAAFGVRFGRWVYRRRWQIIVVWAVALLVGAVYAPLLPRALKAGGYDIGETEASRVLRLLETRFGVHPSLVTVVLQSDGITVDDPAYQAALAHVAESLRTRPGVVGVEQGPVSADRRTTTVNAWLDVPLDQSVNEVERYRDIVPGGPIRAYVTGGPAVYADIEFVSERDLRRAETITFPLAALVLLLVFGTVVAAGAPLLVGAVSVVVTLALLYGIARHTDLSIFVLNTATMIGLGVSIDYSLLFVSRFREELDDGPLDTALARTVATAGEAVLFSGLTVMIGLTGLSLLNFEMLRSVGIGGSIVVGVSALASLTLLPAVLGVVGPRVNALQVLRLRRRPLDDFWPRLAVAVMRRPGAVLGLVCLLIALLTSPVLVMRLSLPDASSLPTDMPSRQGYDILSREFGAGSLAPTIVIVRAPGVVLDAERIGELYDVVAELRALQGVVRVDSLVSLPGVELSREGYQQLYASGLYRLNPQLAAAVPRFQAGDLALLRIEPEDPRSERAGELVRALRARAWPAGWQALVGGTTAGQQDFIERLYGSFPGAILFIVVATYLVLLLLFRSVVLPLKAVLMNSLSVVAAYGVVVFALQEGHLAALLHYETDGTIEALTPIIMFCTLFGLSMDYEVFLLTRIREEWLRTGSNARAVALGLARTGRIITSAALIMVVVAGSFSFTDLGIIKELGVGLAAAIVIDATIIRALLVPATMRLLGDWNWWAPRWLARPAAGPRTDDLAPLTGPPDEAERAAD